MSRIGKRPINIDGVDVSVKDGLIEFNKSGNVVSLNTFNRVLVKLEGKDLIFSNLDDSPQSYAFWGTYRALANNIVIGLTKGFEKSLEINGVGYRASVNGGSLELTLGFSHPIVFPIPNGIDITVEKNIIKVKGVDKQQVGQIAASIRKFRPPEPYKGKGIKYVDEIIIRKSGKTSKK